MHTDTRPLYLVDKLRGTLTIYKAAYGRPTILLVLSRMRIFITMI